MFKKTHRLVKIWQPTYRTRCKEDFEMLISRRGITQSDEQYRKMLDQADRQDYVESSSTNQGGTVVNVVRDTHGFPVCFEVANGKYTDMIPVDRVDLWEQYSFVPNAYGYYGDDPNCMCWEWED